MKSIKNSMESIEMLRNPLKFHEIHGNSMKSIEIHEIHGNSMQSIEIS